MFIERFFSGQIHNISECVYLNKEEALKHCKNHYTYIRHWSFKGDQYIKYNGEDLVWNDGSKVDKRKLPKRGKWGKYFSELHNMCSF